MSLFIGFAVIAWLRGLPWRNLIWDQGMFEPIVVLFGSNWSDWVSSPDIERNLLRLDHVVSIIWLLGGMGVLVGKRLPEGFLRLLLWLGGICLLIHFTLAAKGQFWRIGYILEHSLQVATPFLLLIWLQQKGRDLKRQQVQILAVLTAFTFIGHGLFALGYHPLPAHFVLMTTEGLDFILTDEVAASKVSIAKGFLTVVGILDLIAGALLLLPGNKWKQVALYWVLPWAVLTTLARLWSGAQFSSVANYLTYWIPEFLIRVPHVVLPYLLWRLLRKK